MTRLQTENLRLRAPEPEDLDIMLGYENDSTLWDTSFTTGPYSRYQIKQYIASCTNDFYTDQQLRLMIEHSRYGTVGMADVTNFDLHHNRAEIGILISKEWRRKGFAKEAISLLESHCFTHLDIHQLYVYIATDNIASLRLFADLQSNPEVPSIPHPDDRSKRRLPAGFPTHDHRKQESHSPGPVILL